MARLRIRRPSGSRTAIPIAGAERPRRPRLFDMRFGPRAHLYILPNLFTSASLFLALYSIVKSAEGISANPGEAAVHFTSACWCIILAAVCDALDGPVARLTRTASAFGVQYDSLADCVAFGVAPAFLMYANLKVMDSTMLPTYAPRLALGACALYAICAAIRLARFNVQSETEEKQHFTGLPSPGAAGTVVTTYLFVEWLRELPRIASISAEPAIGQLTRGLHRGSLLLMVILALLMVSEVRFGKLKNLIRPSAKPLNTLVVLVLVACMLITLSEFLPVFLFGAFFFYIGITLVSEARRMLHREPVASAP